MARPTLGNRPRPSPYERLFEAHPLPAWVYDLETLAFLAVNDAAVLLYGYSREDFLSMTIGDIRPAEDVPALRARIVQQPPGLDRAGVWRHCKKDGSVIEVEILSHSIEWQGRPAEVVIATDVTARRATERAAARQRLQIEHLLSSSPTTLYALRFDGASLTPFLVSENITRVMGYESSDVMKASFWPDHVHPDDVPKGATAVERLLAKGHHVHEYRFRHRDGTYRWIRDEMRLLRNDAGQSIEVIGSWSDITAWKAGQDALRESEERFRQAFENAPVGMALVGLDERLLQVNGALCSMLGYAREQLMTMRVPDVTHPEDLEAEATEKARLESGSTSFVMEKRYLRADGGIVHGRLSVSVVRDGAGRNLYFIGQLEDVTERRRTERALQESERRFRSLVEHASDAIALLDAGGFVRYASPAVERMLGYEPSDVVGDHFIEFSGPDDREKLSTRFSECLRHPGEPLLVEAQIAHKGGGLRLIQGRLTNLLQEAGIDAVVVNFHDVTEERDLEVRYRQAQKLESIGRLAGGVAHDFNNLLTVILGYTEFLEADARDGRIDPAAIHEIRRAAERARDLTHHLLTFARRQVLTLSHVNLNDLLRAAERLLVRVVGEDIQIDMHLADDLWTVQADAAQLEQVIVNLAINARDAMKGGGHLAFSTRNVDAAPAEAAAKAGAHASPWVVLTVHDTGHGMTAETLERIFEPFFTTKAAGQGTGLGLATAYGIVKQSGGHIEVRSELGRGTTFTIFLPRAGGAPEPAGPSPRQASVRAGARTVLVVDDDSAVRDLTVRSLEAGGYRVIPASSGSEALALVESSREPIDLLLTDVVMPGPGGRLVAEAILSRQPAVRVLYMSGYAEDRLVPQGQAEPAVELLTKPFTPSVLLARVRRVLS